MVLDKKITKEISIDPEGNMYVGTKSHDNTSNCCWDNSQKNTNVNLMMALEERSQKLSTIQHLETKNVWTRFHGKPQSSCWDISV